MYCNKCGFKYEGNFCPMCGAIAKKTNLPNTKPVEQPKEEENPFEFFYNTEPKTHIETSYEEEFITPDAPEQAPLAEDNSEPVREPEQPIYQQPTPVQPPFYQQNTPTQPQGVPMPPMNCYQPIYHQPQPIPQQAPQRKPLSFWQVLLIVLAGVLTFSLFTYLLPIGMFACAELVDPISESEDYYDYDEEIGDEVINKVEIGENFKDDNFKYCVTKIEDIDKYGEFTPVEGYKFTAVTVEVTNIEEYNSWYGYDIFIYADDEKCQEIIDERYNYSSSSILPYHSYTRTYIFEVPVEAEKTELFLSDFDDELTKIEIK